MKKGPTGHPKMSVTTTNIRCIKPIKGKDLICTLHALLFTPCHAVTCFCMEEEGGGHEIFTTSQQRDRRRKNDDEGCLVQPKFQ